MKQFSLLFVAALVVFFVYAITYAGTIATSSITAQTIIDRAKNDLNSTTNSGVTDPTYSDNDFIQWINEAV